MFKRQESISQLNEVDLFLRKMRSESRNYPIITRNYLHEIARLPPNDAEALFQRVLHDSVEFSQLIGNCQDLRFIAKSSPKGAEVLFQKVLQDSAEFSRLITDIYDLRKVVDSYPQHEEALFNKVLHDPAKFSQFIKNDNDLHEMAELFPQYAEVLFQKVLDDPAKISQFIGSHYDLHEMKAKLSPKGAEALFQRFLYDPAEFSRLIRDMDDLREAAKLFPQHKEIFGKPTIAEALEALKALRLSIQERQKQQSIVEVEKNVTILYELFEARLPTALMVSIAAMTADKKCHSQVDAIQIGEKQANATMIKHQGLFNARQTKNPEQQYEFDKQVRVGNFNR